MKNTAERPVFLEKCASTFHGDIRESGAASRQGSTLCLDSIGSLVFMFKDHFCSNAVSK